jgi:hypothetical protein
MRLFPTITLGLLLLAFGVTAAPKKKPGKKPDKGKSALKVSKKAEPLLKAKTFTIEGRLKENHPRPYLLPTKGQYGSTTLWAIDLPSTIGKTKLSKFYERRVKVTFRGSAAARADNSLKITCEKGVAIVALDKKPPDKRPVAKKSPVKGKSVAKAKNVEEEPASLDDVDALLD